MGTRRVLIVCEGDEGGRDKTREVVFFCEGGSRSLESGWGVVLRHFDQVIPPLTCKVSK